MSEVLPSVQSRTLAPALHVLRELLARQPVLARFGLALLALAALTLLPLALDLRLVNGEPAWLKPFKFFVSLALFALTSAWFFGYLRPEGREHWLGRIVVYAIVSMSAFEMTYIVLQSLRGLPSHFFTSDPFHRLMYGLMGYGAVILTTSQLVLAIALLRFGRSDLPRMFLAAVIAGLLLTWALGTMTGLAMGSRAERYVGGVIPAATLPVLGWSLTGGDWRPAHFLALHAQQIVPVAGALLTARAPWTGYAGVAAIVAAHAALTLFALLQAASGRPFLP